MRLPAPGAPLHKGNAHQRPGIFGSPDAPGKVAVWWPAGPLSEPSPSTAFTAALGAEILVVLAIFIAAALLTNWVG